MAVVLPPTTAPVSGRGKLGKHYRKAVVAGVRHGLVELAWAAGFLEGEGCFVMAGTSPRVVGYQSEDWTPISRLLKLFGGTYTWGQRPGRKVGYAWFAHGARALGVMQTIYPLVGHRRQMQIRGVLARVRGRGTVAARLAKRNVGISARLKARGYYTQRTRDGAGRFT